MLTRFRKWLETNKIFFEVFVAITLPIIAIYISVQANRIAENQTRIMEEENLPQLELRMNQEYNESIKIYDNNVWSLYNRGGKLSNLSIDKMSFIRFTNNGTNKWNEIELPIYGYFAMHGILTGESEGLIYQIDNNKNGFKELQLRNQLLNDGQFEVEAFIGFTYLDIFDNRHSLFFKCSPSITPVLEEEWLQMQKKQNEADSTLYFPKVSASDILKIYNVAN